MTPRRLLASLSDVAPIPCRARLSPSPFLISLPQCFIASSSLSSLAATLMDLPASVANKRLPGSAKPFSCNTYKKHEGTPYKPNAFLFPPGLGTFRCAFCIPNGVTGCVSDLSPVFSNSCALFRAQQRLNSFLFKRFRTLCQKPPGVGGVLPILELDRGKITAGFCLL